MKKRIMIEINNVEQQKLIKKRKRVIFFVKLVVYILVFIMYYLFFQIFLMFLNIYLEKYRKNIENIYKTLSSEKQKIFTLKSNIEEKKSNYLSLILKTNNEIDEIKNKQKDILNKIKKALENDIIAYGYYCSLIKNKILSNKKKLEIDDSFIQLNLKKYNPFLRKKIKDKFGILVKNRNTLIQQLDIFYKNECNQESRFKILAKKVFDKNLGTE